jgi:ribonucleoside-diphosphate reductase alpha chain
MLAGVNSGLEPFFALEYERNDRMGKSIMRPKPFEEWRDKHPEQASINQIPDYFVTADQLTVEEHVAIQAAAQKYIDSSISKTVNAPNSHTVEDVDKLYRLCYDSGLKGISYFRDGCNRGVVLSRPKEEEKEKIESHDTHTASPYMRPEKVFGVTQRKRTKHGHAFVTVNYAEDNGPIEAFVQVGRASSDISEWAEGLGRLISLGLRYGISKEVIAEQLTGVGGYSKMQPSLSTAVGEALRDASMGDVPVEPVRTEVPATAQVLAPSTGFTPEICTQCGSAAFVREEGCMKCQVCGNSKC